MNYSYPNYCNDSWPLKENDIGPIEDEMRAHWPAYGSTWESIFVHLLFQRRGLVDRKEIKNTVTA